MIRWGTRICAAAVAAGGFMFAAQAAGASDANTSWTQVTGQAAFSGVTLSGVTCTSSSHCEAVGRSISNGTSVEQALVGDNGTWTSQNAATGPGQDNGSLSSVSCVAADDCIGVGEYSTPSGPSFDTYHALVEHWDGTSWSVIPAPFVGDTYNFLFGVTCVPGTGGNSNECTAVGEFSNTFSSPHGQQTLVLQGTEGVGGWTFSHVSSPNPGMTNDVLEAVRCPTYTTCLAVGHAETFFQSSGNFSGALALQGTDSGGTWTWSTLSTDSTGGVLTGLDCTSAQACMAVGAQGSPEQSLVETWNGSGGFTPVSSPNPGGYSTGFSGLSCVSDANCTTVGSTVANQGGWSAPLIMQWDGAQWWQVTAPSSGTGSAQLNSVTCDIPTNACTGVGFDNTDALVDTGPGFVAASSGTTGTQGGGAQGGGSPSPTPATTTQGGGAPAPTPNPGGPRKPKKSNASPTLTISSATVNRGLRGIVVELASRHGNISGVEVDLYRGRTLLARVRLAKVTGRGSRVVLSSDGRLPPPGRYTVRARKAGRGLASREVIIAALRPVSRPPRFTG